MYADGWGGNHRNPPPRDNYATRPFSGNPVPNRGPANDLADMAATMRAMTKLAANRDREPGYRPNTEPPRERPQPAREDPYARRQDTDRREDPYARRQDSRRQEDPRRSGSPRKDDPYARRNDPEPYREDPYARRNEQRKWADSPKDSTQWPGSHMIARAGFPAYRWGYDQPLQAQRSPYVNRQDARRSLVSDRRYSGSSGASYRSGSSYSSRSGRLLSENKFRLIIAVIVGVTLLAMALGGVALWLFLKNDDVKDGDVKDDEAYPIVYEVNVHLQQQNWTEGMNDTDNQEYKDMNKKYCDAMTNVFGGVLLKCVVDNLKKGSVHVYSSLTFDWNNLTDLVKKTEKKNIYAYIKSEIEKSDDDFLKDAIATVQVIPDTAEYVLKLHLAGMNFTDDLKNATSTLYKNTATDYCKAMKEAFSDTMKGCDVTGYEEGSVIVNSKLSFDTAKLKEKAKADGGSADLANLGSILKNELKKAANTTDFFKANGLDADKIDIKSETKTTTTTTTTTTAIVVIEDTSTTQGQDSSPTTAIDDSTATTPEQNAAPTTTSRDSTATTPEQNTATTTTDKFTVTTPEQNTATTTTETSTAATPEQNTATTTTETSTATTPEQNTATTTTETSTATTPEQNTATTTTETSTAATPEQNTATTTTETSTAATPEQNTATTTTETSTAATPEQNTATTTTETSTATTPEQNTATTTTETSTATTPEQNTATTTTETSTAPTPEQNTATTTTETSTAPTPEQNTATTTT
ncbi:hypothetical protein LSAT2_005850 [Lamellibrachia satsuma]|nr:hypothetical protein LSAT2_005850 [Lamellibrachia satsuma]